MPSYQIRGWGPAIRTHYDAAGRLRNWTFEGKGKHIDPARPVDAPAHYRARLASIYKGGGRHVAK